MNKTGSNELLEEAYRGLGYADGDLIDTSIDYAAYSLDDWLAKGTWLTIGEKVGAEKILFVDNNPVVVFARADTSDLETLRTIYNNIWCMARPRLLFLAKLGQLAVYDLAKAPIRTIEDWEQHKPLDIALTLKEVTEKLGHYARSQIETGHLFEDSRFGLPEFRADKSLIRDLKTIRATLMDGAKGLKGDKLRFAHALIGRSIFIRYLEDRGILTHEYFNSVAQQKEHWVRMLNEKPSKPDIDPDMEGLLYPRVLGDKNFTYALFTKLAQDFNGDMFPQSEEEQNAVDENHLLLLQQFLRGDVQLQRKLFFFAYRFDIIPLELISTIYEEFYQAETGKNKTQASYYTPPALVDFMLSRVLTKDTLINNPRILDPACGSGVFLVEAFKLIVRYRCHKENRRLGFPDFIKILREQISGIDINSEAVQVAAFSIYLAILNFLDPPDILNLVKQGNRLPHLIAKPDDDNSDSLNTLLIANAFGIESSILSEQLKNKFCRSCTDIIITNPPWGSPGKEDITGLQANKVALDWCAEHKRSVGDKERSQTFLWKAIDSLCPGGVGALLVSAGIFYKHSKPSIKFRSQLFSSVTVETVFNFTHTRKVFFKESSSPFVIIIFENSINNDANHVIHYWAAKATAEIESLQAVLLNSSDLKLIKQSNAKANPALWKILWWGTHQDEVFINYLSTNKRLRSLTKEKLYGQGFKEGNKKLKADWLENYQELRPKEFHRYGAINQNWLTQVPKRVEHRGIREVYEGLRLLVKRGIDQKTLPKGRIIARVESGKFCFRNSVHGVKFVEGEESLYKCILGILWSSIARYYFFMTSSTWGIWHDEVHLDELLDFPIKYPENRILRDRIVKLVDELASRSQLTNDLPFDRQNEQDLIKIENSLDEAIFELYELSDVEIDLVRDLCEIGIDYYYSGFRSAGGKPVTSIARETLDSSSKREKNTSVYDYIKVFIDTWGKYLDTEDKFVWHVIAPKETSMMAVRFSVRNKDDSANEKPIASSDSWNVLLNQTNLTLTPLAGRRIYVDGIIRLISEKEIVIIKRNERRFWTRTSAREDAEATLTQAMNRESFVKGTM